MQKAWTEKHRNGYRIRWIGPDGRRKSESGGTSRREAEKNRQRIQRRIQTGSELPGITAPSFDHLLDMMSRDFAPQKSANYWYQIKHALARLKDYAGPGLEGVTVQVIDRMQADLLKSLKEPTVNKNLRHCGVAFKKAKDWELIPENPFDRVGSLREPDIEINTLSPEDENVIRSYAHRLIDICMINLALDGGLRAQEIANLHIYKDVNIKSRQVKLINRENRLTKNKRNRTVYLSKGHLPDMALFIQLCRENQRNPFAFWDGNAHSVSQAFSRIKRMAGIDIKLHDLRRTCCTRMLEAGVPIHDVCKYMGHSSIAVTERYYTKIREDAMANARELTDRKGQ